jgi:hypothetical protein
LPHDTIVRQRELNIMKAKQQLGKPENWQDFENLCKKLWSEIWKCPEIKKNGRQGQAQNGVDIYGIPFGESYFYGIQCKGKDEYTHAQLTEKEINIEIEKAKLFEPKLKKLYFATTANKDAIIETIVRKKNIEHLKFGLFEVHIFSWEDIVDLVEENKHTYDFYVKSISYKTEHEVKFVFENDEDELVVEVPYLKTINRYVLHDNSTILAENAKKPDIYSSIFSSMAMIKDPFSSFNHSLCRFYFRLHNIGNEPLQEFKIFLNFNGDFEEIDTCSKGHFLLPNLNLKYDTFIWKEDKSGKIIPLKNLLVSEDTIAFDTIYIKPYIQETEVIINWRLVSLNYKTEGNLKLIIKPTYKVEERIIYVYNSTKVRDEIQISDYITDKNSKE